MGQFRVGWPNVARPGQLWRDTTAALTPSDSTGELRPCPTPVRRQLHTMILFNLLFLINLNAWFHSN
jgi:hypothetical protein